MTSKVAYITAFSVIGLIILSVIFALTGHTEVAVGLALLFVAVAIGACWKILSFAEKNPAIALLEGSEYLRYKEMEQATNDKSIVIDETAQPISNPSLIGNPKGAQDG